MRKFLMVAAVVAVAACGKKQADTTAEQAGAAAGATVDTMVQKADSTMGAMADSAHAAMAPAAAAATDSSKAVVQKAADAVSAPAEGANTKMEAKPAPATK